MYKNKQDWKNWRVSNNQLVKQYQNKSWQKNKIKYNTNRKNLYQQNPEKFRQQTINHKRKLKNIVMIHYSKGVPQCNCCGELIMEFLTIDHILGRKNFNHDSKVGGTALYRWLIKNNFPDGFQVLCFNCNITKYQYGICPHQKLVKTEVEIIGT